MYKEAEVDCDFQDLNYNTWLSAKFLKSQDCMMLCTVQLMGSQV